MSWTRKHRRSSKVAVPESDAPTLPFFFLFLFYSRQNGPIQAKTDRFRRKWEPIRPKRTPKHADTANSGQNGHQNRLIRPIPAKTGRNGQRLPFFCFMWPCERKKKKKERRKKKMRRRKKNGWKKNKGM